MINQIFKLIEPKKIEIDFQEINLPKNHIIVRPTYMSICAADQRYYQGKRKKEILEEKLPLTLIHESVGQVLYDPLDEFKRGEIVALIPNTPYEEDNIIKENYRKSTKFRSSNQDGFMQGIVKMRRNRILRIGNIKPEIGSMIELISVAINGIENFKEKAHNRKNTLAVWGDGSVAYVTALMLKEYFPNSKVVIFGLHDEKLSYFSFADKIMTIDNFDSKLKIDHVFECVGGVGAETAIEQIINIIQPQGCINLMGVSEISPHINTRMILEKGLTVLGNSRSGYSDFKRAIDILQKEQVQDYIENIICKNVEINSINDIHSAFEEDINNNFKTVMKWNI